MATWESMRFVVGADGQPAAAQINMNMWQQIVAALKLPIGSGAVESLLRQVLVGRPCRNHVTCSLPMGRRSLGDLL